MLFLQAIIGARTDLHRLSMEACHRLSKEWQGGADRGLPAPRDRPLSDHVPRHRLSVVGYGLDMDHSSVVLCPG